MSHTILVWDSSLRLIRSLSTSLKMCMIKHCRRYFPGSERFWPAPPGVLTLNKTVWERGTKASLIYCHRALIISCNSEAWELPFHLAQYIESFAFTGLLLYRDEWQWLAFSFLLRVLPIKYSFLRSMQFRIMEIKSLYWTPILCLKISSSVS